MNVTLADEARENLRAIGDFVRQHNPERAARFVAELLNRCDELANMPRAFPLVPRYEQAGIRRRVYHDYLIFYRVRAIEVIHIRHGAQDYDSLLFRRNE